MEQEKNLAQMFKNRAAKFGDKPLLRCKKDGRWVALSYKDVERRATDIALGFLALGFKRSDRISLLAENRPEWAMVDLATQFLGGILATIYATNTPEQCAYIVNNSESRFVVVSNNNQLNKLTGKGVRLPLVEKIVIFDAIDGITDRDVRVLPLAKLEELGRAYDRPEELDKAIAATTFDDVATLIYTSGTTGDPKGVMLTHGNFYTNAQSCISVTPVTENETFLSFLPLSHSLERTAGHWIPLYIGATINYAESIEALRQNLQEIKPTTMVSVPRIYEKFHAAITDNVGKSSPVKQKLFAWALATGKKIGALKRDHRPIPYLLALQNDLADKLVFEKIKATLGGKLRYAVSGGAPLAPELFEFFFALGVTIYEGYGLTETTPIVTCNTPAAVRMGSVGRVIPGVTVKIADDGEILVRGPNVMKGYYKAPEATAEAIVDGWFHTGDIGELDADGFLRITDRKKDLIVTAGGKNVAPQNIENLLKMDRYIEQVNIIGDRRRYLTAIIVPNLAEVEKWAQAKGLKFVERPELVKLPEVKQLLQESVEKVNRQLAKYESIKKFYVTDVVFSQENDMLTPTMKVKRKKVNARFAKEIEAMYEE
jgi:long-chain acyl-CoA synthetase